MKNIVKNVVIILEKDVLEQELHIGRSGDLVILKHFFERCCKVFVVTAQSMQINEFGNLESLNLNIIEDIQCKAENIYNKSTYQEYLNILNGNLPSYGVTPEMHTRIIIKPCKFNEIGSIDILLSRAMPQSLTEQFLLNFQKLKEFAEIAPQNMAEICLYKDKAIPYLLQNNPKNLSLIYEKYSQKLVKFKNEITKVYSSLAIETIIIDATQSHSEIEKVLTKIPLPVCIKPFNLFGGVGVGVFQNYSDALNHFKKINNEFEKYQINEKRLVLAQKAVKTPEFGDIRAVFSYGKFLGAFKRYEPIGQIHNTINGAMIIPVSDFEFNFANEFEENLRKPFIEAIHLLKSLFLESEFLKSEFICGCDFLLDHTLFKLTEINIACPTGFVFLEASLLCIKYGRELNIEDLNEYFSTNGHFFDNILTDLS